MLEHIARAPSTAQGYPTRPVRVVVGFRPWAEPMRFARIVAQKLSTISAISS